MKTNPKQTPGSRMPAWIYTVRDYLDLRCGIRGRHAGRLIAILARRFQPADRIEAPPALLVKDCLVVISGRSAIHQFWIYDQENGSLKRAA